MASITRPTDNRGGSIYDLQLLHGIGPKSAIDLYDKGVTLEGLMKEWTDLITKNPKNAPSQLFPFFTDNFIFIYHPWYS